MKHKAGLILFLIIVQTTTLLASKCWAVLSSGENLLHADSLLISEELLEFQLQGAEGASNDYPYNNHSGWGLIYYNEARLDTSSQIWHSPTPAIDDTSYQDVVEVILNEANAAKIALGHVRRATTGSEDIPNPHPFHQFWHGKSLAMAHNGTISKDRLFELLTDDGNTFDWIQRTPPDSHGCGQWNLEGWDCVVDSDLYFKWLVMNIHTYNDVYTGLRMATTHLYDYTGSNYELNYVFSDGQDLYGFRSTDENDDRHDMYYATQLGVLPEPYSDVNQTHYALMSYHPQDSTAGAMDWQNLQNLQNILLTPDHEPQFYSSRPSSILKVPHDYPTIQSAIDAAEDYDHVLVEPGVYEESIDFMGKEIIVSSEYQRAGGTSTDVTIIRGTIEDYVVRIGEGAGNHAVLTGFTLTATENSHTCILVEDASPLLNNLILNGGTGLAAVVIDNGNPKLSNMVINQNSYKAVHAVNSPNLELFDVMIAGILINDNESLYFENSSVRLFNCTIAGAQIPAGSRSIYLSESDLTILNSILWHEDHTEIEVNAMAGESSIFIAYSNVNDGELGIQTNANATLIWGEGNLEVDPIFTDSGSNDFTLADTSPLQSAGTEYFENEDIILLDLQPFEYAGDSPNMGSFQPLDEIHYGCTDPLANNHDPLAEFEDGHCTYDPFGTIWVPETYPTIQRAVDVASHGDSIIVAPGVYHEAVNFLSKDIILGSYFLLDGDTSHISQTIIDGSGVERPVDIYSLIDPPAELAGFTLRNGLANGGGGLRIRYSSHPWVHDLVIEDCESTSNGGGVYLSNTSLPLFENVVIRNCDGSGGGAAYISGCDLTFKNCRFESNHGSNGGAVYISKANPIFERVLFADNTANVGGAIYITAYNSSAKPVYANCTIVNNSANSAGAIQLSSEAQPFIYNSILWGNLPNQIGVSTSQSSKAIVILHSDVQGGEAGLPDDDLFTSFWLGGNIEFDPIFHPVDSEEYKLTEFSPCVDAGIQDSLIIFDEGNQEFQIPSIVWFGDAPDMGWVEFIGPVECLIGDSNGDSGIDVLDVVLAVQFILVALQPTDVQFCATDVNGDYSLDILDLVAMVDIILES